MDVHDLVERVPSERARRLLHVTFQVTQDPAPDWLRPAQLGAAGTLLVGFVGLALVPLPLWVWSVLITLGALATLALRLLSLRWAPALTGQLAPHQITVAPGGSEAGDADDGDAGTGTAGTSTEPTAS